MLIIRQERFGRRDRFTVSVLAEDGESVLGEPRVVDPQVKIVREDGHDYFLLRYTNGVSDDRFYDFMNIKLKGKPIKTRMAAATALRRFYCFLEIYHLRMEMLSEDDWRNLEYFMLGKHFAPEGLKAALAQRSVQTANNYLTVAQRFLREEGIHYEFLEVETQKTRYIDFGGVRLGYSFTKNIRTLKGAAHDDDWVPMYVNPAQFKALLEVVNRHDDRLAVIMIKMMYFYALRLGECLGLTQEDIVLCENVPGDRGPVPMLRLRNRPTDADCQRSKNIVTMTEDPSSALGPRTYVLLTKTFYSELQQYVQSTFEYWYAKNPERMAQPEATILTKNFDQDINHYIFRNNYGKPLMDAAWNVRLKRYYREAGIHVDEGRKQANLSHQLRHGCAMLLYRFLPKELRLTEEQLRRFLRHKRLETTQIYNKATVYEEYCFLESFQADMARELPFINSGYEVLERERRERLPATCVAPDVSEEFDEDMDDGDLDYLDDLD